MKQIKNYFFCEPLKQKCTGENTFLTVNDFFNKSNILWKNCVSVTANGGAALTGIKNIFQGKVTELASHGKFLRCVSHRQALAAKRLEPKMHEVLQDAIYVVNVMKTRPLNSRIFTILCNKMGSYHKNLLHPTKLHWFSYGEVLKIAVELEDVTHFSFTKNQVFKTF